MEDVQDEGRHYAIEQVRAEDKRRVVGVYTPPPSCHFTSLKY